MLQIIMRTTRITHRIFLLLFLLILAACTGNDDEPTTTSRSEQPTATVTLTAPPATSTDLSPTSEPSPTVPATATSTPIAVAAGIEDSACAALVTNAYDITQQACNDTGRDEACYGNVLIDAEPANLPFTQTGDTVSLQEVESLSLSSMNTESQEWGISLMRIRANLPEDDSSQNVELLLFGNVEIGQANPTDSSQFEPMQAFYFTSGVDDSPCEEAPDSGILIQTPEGAGEITLLVNEVNIDLGSTAYLQAQPGAEMVVNTIEGQATITSAGTTVTSPAGTRVRIPLDTTGLASGAPGNPEPYVNANLQSLPVVLLSEQVAVAPALTQEEITALVGVGEADTIMRIEDEIEANVIDTFTFNAVPGQTLYFELLRGTPDCCNIQWILRDEAGTSVFGNYFFVDQEVVLERGGTYTLTLEGMESFTGPYSFQILNVPAPQTTALDLNPQTGTDLNTRINGNFEAIGAQDIYTFSTEPGQSLYFEIIQGTGDCCDISWDLQDETGFKVFDGFFYVDQEHTLERGGTYTLTIDGESTRTGPYSFRIHNVPAPQSFALNMGDIVGLDQPTSGAGHIETIGAQDIYTFDAETGQTINLQLLQGSGGCCDLSATLVGPDGEIVFDTFYYSDQQFTAEQAGIYTLTMDGELNWTGPYSFQLVDTSAEAANLPNQQNLLVTGEEGTIETPGTTNDYTFTANPGQIVYFQPLETPDNCCDLTWILTDEDGTEIFNAYFVNAQELTLERGGTYTLTVRGNSGFTGDYSFQILDVPDPETFAIRVGNIVALNRPAAGAGNIEVIGAKDIYTFSTQSAQSLYFEVLTGTASCCNLTWVLTDEEGTRLFDTWFSGSQELTLERAGTYTLTLDGAATNTSVYSFRIVPVPAPDTFAIAIGDIVNNLDTLPGAGNLEAIGAKDIYTFTGQAGQTIYIDIIDNTPSCCDASWMLQDESGTQVFDAWFAEDAEVTLESDGIYTLTMDGVNKFTGLYSFSILDVPPSQTFAIEIGDSIEPADSVREGAGNIEAIGTKDFFTFTAEAQQGLYLQVLEHPTSCCNISWKLTTQDQEGNEVRIFDAWFGSDQEVILEQAGTYTLVLDGVSTYTGTYGFQLMPITPPQTFNIKLGDTVAPSDNSGMGNIESVGAQDIYSFTASAGQTLTFEVIESPACCDLSWNLVDANNSTVFDLWLSVDTTIEIENSGRYTLIVDGVNTFTGTYSFRITAE